MEDVAKYILYPSVVVLVTKNNEMVSPSCSKQSAVRSEAAGKLVEAESTSNGANSILMLSQTFAAVRTVVVPTLIVVVAPPKITL